MRAKVHLRLVCILMCGLSAFVVPLAAQVSIGDNLKMSASGGVGAGYNGNYGSNGSSHGLDLNGMAEINGSYYDPRFLNFSLTPFYSRSQSNSESASVTDASGLGAHVGLFGGSTMPGGVNYYWDHNKSGTYGIANNIGLTTVGSDHGFDVGWDLHYAGLPFSVSYHQSASNSSILGTENENQSTSRGISGGTHFPYRGYVLYASFNWMSGHSESNYLLSLGSDRKTISNNSSFNIQAGGQHKLPMNGQMNFQYTRTHYASDFVSSELKTNGNSDSFSTSASIHPEQWVSLSGSATYTDNQTGGAERELVNTANMVVPMKGLQGTGLQLSSNLFVNISRTAYLNGYATYSEQTTDGVTRSANSLGCNLNYVFLKNLFRGLTVNGGVTDSATKEGNTNAGFVGNVNYIRRVRGWQISGNYTYSQNVQTIYALNTTSAMGYAASLQHRFSHNRYMILIFNGGRSGFTDQPGTMNHRANTTAGFNIRQYRVYASYFTNSGQSIATPAGLIGIQLPTGTVLSEYEIHSNGTGYNVGGGTVLFRRLSLSGSYAHSDSSTVGATTNPSYYHNNSETAALYYRMRKLTVVAGYTRLQQSSLTSSSSHTVLNNYYIGISRYFSLF